MLLLLLQIWLLESYRITKLPIEKNPFEKIIEDLGGQVRSSIIKNELGKTYPYYQKVNELMNMEKYKCVCLINLKFTNQTFLFEISGTITFPYT